MKTDCRNAFGCLSRKNVGKPGRSAAISVAAGHAERIILVDPAIVCRGLGVHEHGIVFAEVRVVIGDIKISALTPVASPAVSHDEGAVTGGSRTEVRT